MPRPTRLHRSHPPVPARVRAHREHPAPAIRALRQKTTHRSKTTVSPRPNAEKPRGGARTNRTWLAMYPARKRSPRRRQRCRRRRGDARPRPQAAAQPSTAMRALKRGVMGIAFRLDSPDDSLAHLDPARPHVEASPVRAVHLRDVDGGLRVPDYRGATKITERDSRSRVAVDGNRRGSPSVWESPDTRARRSPAA